MQQAAALNPNSHASNPTSEHAAHQQVLVNLQVAVDVRQVGGAVQRGPPLPVALVDRGSIVDQVMHLLEWFGWFAAGGWCMGQLISNLLLQAVVAQRVAFSHTVCECRPKQKQHPSKAQAGYQPARTMSS